MRSVRRPRRVEPHRIVRPVTAWPVVLMVALAALVFGVSCGCAAPPPEGFADLVEVVKPAVVNVAATLKYTSRGAVPRLEIPPELGGTPFEEFLRRLLESPGSNGDAAGPIVSLGSGFLVDPSGYVVTNRHVIEYADKIQVTLADGRKFDGHLIGSDEETDLALLKVEAGVTLPAAVSWGDSDKARVGDWILAVGNPYGLGGTVTAGIISARGRDIQTGRFDDYLQIDAPINRGNSGGPSFDRTGRVIGVNTAIYSPSGGSIGIAFAIPSSVARPIVDELRARGHIERGWLGVSVQALTPDIAAALGLGADKGALVTAVTPNSPAAAAGLRRRDVIHGVNGQTVDQSRDLPRIIAAVGPGKRVRLGVWRNGTELVTAVTLGHTPVPKAAAETVGREPAKPSRPSANPLGLVMVAIDGEIRRRYGLDQDATGVLVLHVESGGAGADAGLLPGDIIVEAGDRRARDANDVAGSIREAKAHGRKALLLLIRRDNAEDFLAVRLS